MDLTQLLRDLWKRCHWPEMSKVCIMTLRGCRVEDGKLVLLKERTNLYDDTMFLIDPTRGIRWHANCTGGQPGWYWVNKYGKGEGAPFTRPCCVKYIRGIHRGEYEAMVQARDDGGVIPVIRDVDKDGQADFSPESPDVFDYPHFTGINIHASGGFKETVDWASSGCHVIQSPWNDGPWREFHSFIYDSYSTQREFWYGVADARWAFDTAERILWGSVGEPVDLLVHFLESKGIEVETNYGVFRQSLDEGYRKWQRTSGQGNNGICVNAPWTV